MVRSASTRSFAIGLAVLMMAATLGSIAAPPAGAMPSGQLGAWGAGKLGELGDGNAADSVAAVSVLSTGVLAGKTIVQVDAGDAHACAVTSDGALACWGSNQFGQLGIGGTQSQPTPQAVTGGVLAGKAVVQVSAGYKHTCALTQDGLLACWGEASVGALGNQPPVSSPIPVAVFTGGVLAGRTITQVSAGWLFTCAVASGAAFCWGANGSGQLGDGSTTSRLIPVASVASGASALAGKTVTQISAGQNHTCARSSDGSLACWGANGVQQVLPSTTVGTVTVPIAEDQGALAGRSVSQVSAGANFVCAVASGSVVCWGSNNSGQLANGPVSNTPQGVPALATTTAPSGLAGKTVMAISAGGFHACAVTTDATIACWGRGGSGELGTSAAPAGLPVPFSVTGTPGSGVMGGAIARGVTAGTGFSLGLTSSLPDVPSGLAAKAGDAQAAVSWKSPVATGGSPITSFVVQQSTDAGTTWMPAVGSPVAGDVTSLVVTKLPNGVNVTFRVAAVTVAGQGPFSAPTSVVTPTAAATPTPTPTPTATPTAPAATKPGVVQALTRSEAKRGVVVLSWQSPTTGSAPTSYQVRRKQGAHRYSAWTTVPVRTVTIRGLKRGKQYSFAVRAANAAGFGPGAVVKLTVR